MVDPVTWRRFVFRCLFVLVCVLVIFTKMLPLDTTPATVALFDPATGLLSDGGFSIDLPGPDLLFCFTAAFIMRRPRWAPVALIVAVHFLSDVLFLRPPGLWTAVSLMAYEFLRGQSLGPAETPVPLEVALVTGAFAGAVLANALVHLIFALPHPGLGLSLLHVLTTAVAYPFVIAVTHFMLGVRRARPGDLDSSGVTG